ncbi:mucosal addressin cell adhesion molecule 1 [Sarcophilus harrisii]|uniref:mucosal addressin cell adhesion molecule 1 n=1 Tax=Sarcophilus harrisii TaxID=9305 RepID=UPI001301D2DF|nr:mucosal addressin cell adhesion molecule 1 [Sarcophilus harrisii]
MNEAALPVPLTLLVLLLFLLLQGQSSWGAPREGENPLRITPAWPVVPAGGSIKLNCSLTCSKEATVQWKGLDTSLGHVSSVPGLSVLTIPEATLSMAGRKVCISTCQDTTYQDSVELLVYAFPDKVEVSPSILVPGQGATLVCSAREVSPYDKLNFTWYRGDEKLEGLWALDDDLGPEQEAETGEELEVFWVTKRWVLPAELVTLGPEFRCLVEMDLGHQALSHSRAIAVTSRMTSPAPSTLLPTTTTVGPAPPSSVASTVQGYSSGPPDPTASSLTRGPGSSLPLTSNPSSGDPCLPKIFLSPVPGAGGGTLELTCQACEPGTSVHWIRAPGRLADYQGEEAGARATLILHPGPRNWGMYQCQVEPGSQKTSCYLDKELLPEMDGGNSSAALWTGGGLLGLILVAFVAYRLWRWLRAQGTPEAARP